jgi:hypothetical protein
MDPIFSMFAVTDDYDYNNPICGSSWMCRPNVAPSSIGIYESDAIPSWTNSLLVTSLKRGRVYRLKLDEEGNAIAGDTTQHFYTTNRYRDIVVHPNGKTFYMITDQEGNTSDASGLNIERDMKNPGTILQFTLQESSSVIENQLQGVSVWPNPIRSEFTINIENTEVKSLDAVIMNLNGQTVSTLKDLQVGQNTRNLSGLTSGVYFLKVFSKEKVWTTKLTVL